jgi:ribosome-associated protein
MDDLRITDNIIIPVEELEASFTRSSGPGGQNVNKVNSKVTLRWEFTKSPALSDRLKKRLAVTAASKIVDENVIQVTSQESRDQPSNMQTCRTKIRNLVLAALKPVKVRVATKPTKSSQRRRLQEKKAKSDRKDSRSKPNWD